MNPYASEFVAGGATAGYDWGGYGDWTATSGATGAEATQQQSDTAYAASILKSLSATQAGAQPDAGAGFEVDMSEVNASYGASGPDSAAVVKAAGADGEAAAPTPSATWASYFGKGAGKGALASSTAPQPKAELDSKAAAPAGASAVGKGGNANAMPD